jgi:hypothetical protein
MKRCNQTFGMIEVEGVRLHCAAERIRALRGIREGAYPMPIAQQAAGDIFARVPKRAGDHLPLLSHACSGKSFHATG